MTTAADVAKYLIRLAALDPEGEPMTAMRLHKLLYYCQGWHLAWFGRPLFADRIEAWQHGPVVKSVYNQPWGQGRNPLPDAGDPADLTDDARRAVDRVWAHYREFSACGLRNRTHEEPPWKDHYEPDSNARCSREIPVADLSGFFGGEYLRQTGEEPGTAGESASNAAGGRAVGLEELMREFGR